MRPSRTCIYIQDLLDNKFDRILHPTRSRGFRYSRIGIYRHWSRCMFYTTTYCARKIRAICGFVHSIPVQHRPSRGDNLASPSFPEDYDGSVASHFYRRIIENRTRSTVQASNLLELLEDFPFPYHVLPRRSRTSLNNVGEEAGISVSSLC